tara:strand:- start:373 stop:927 length:555 start_codon:yes stop_codon:yes gene_type:complete
MKINKRQLRKMISEAFKGYQYASRDGSRYQGTGPSQTFKLKEADVPRLEQVILESLQASLKSGHQLATAVHSAAFNIQQSGAIPVLNMEVSEFDDEYIKDTTGITSYSDIDGNLRPYGQEGDDNHASQKKTMLSDTKRALEEACDNAYYKVLDSAGSLSHDMMEFVVQFMIELKKDILDSVRSI